MTCSWLKRGVAGAITALAALVVFVPCLVCSVWAAGDEDPATARLSTYVSPSLVQDQPATQPFRAAAARLSDSADSSLQSPHRALTSGARWEKFEAEFGLREKNPSMVMGSVESAKYTLDRTTFAVTDFIEQTLKFDYQLSTLGHSSTPSSSAQRVYSDPILDAWQNARFKSDVNMNAATGGPYFGVRLELPLGK